MSEGKTWGKSDEVRLARTTGERGIAQEMKFSIKEFFSKFD